MISAIVLTKNEESNIKDCLESLSWCDELVVIDDCSEDQTIKIAKDLGARVITHALDNNFSNQRNFALSQAKYDWVFFVDADERVSEKLREEIKNEISDKSSDIGQVKGFYFKRRDFFEGRWLKHGETGSLKILRLARRGSGEWKRMVDEIWEITGKTKTFKNHLLHNAHPNLTNFLETINQRSTLNARQFYQEQKKENFFSWFKPPLKFVYNYFFRLGFLDGTAGFVFAVLMSFHSFLVRGKLYLIWRKEGGWR